MRFVSTALARTLLVMSAICLESSIAGAEECRKDSDCPGDTVCDEGRCVGTDGPATKPKSTAPAAPASAAPAAQAGPAAPLPGAVKVEFVPRNPKESLVVRDRYTNASCTAPCSLELPPGTRAIQVGNSKPEDFEIPPQGGTFSVAEPQRAMRTTGIVLLSVGAPIAILSALLVVAAANAEKRDPEAPISEPPQDNSGVKTGGTIVAVTAGALAVIGLVALVSADTKALRPEATKAHGAASKPITLLPVANVDTRGGGFVGLGGTF